MCDAFAQSVRDCVARALPRGAFLRRDRGGALYITDAPRRAPDGAWQGALRQAGFTCVVANGLARIAPEMIWLEDLEGAFPHPPDFLSASLARFKGRRPDPTANALFVCGLKVLEAHEGDRDFERSLRRHAAVCLRDPSHTGGGLYACAIIRHLIEKERAT